MSELQKSHLFQGSFFRLRYPSGWQQEIIEDVVCFFREDTPAVLQIAASRKQEGSLNLQREISTYLNRNQIDLDNTSLVEYQTRSGLDAIASEYWNQDRFWLVQFIGRDDKLLIVLFNGEDSPNSDLAHQISFMLDSIEYV